MCDTYSKGTDLTNDFLTNINTFTVSLLQLQRITWTANR